MSAVTSPLRPWHWLMTKVPSTLLLAFLLVSLPLTAISFYVVPFFEYAIPKFVWLIVLLLAALLFQIRSSMEHVSNRYLNALTSYPINFVGLPTLYMSFLVFSSPVSGTQSFVAAFLGLATLFYAMYALVHKRTDSTLYKLLTRPGSPLVQFLVAFALVMVAVWALPNPAQAQSSGPAASWQAQLAAAQAKVAERDSNAVLSRVTTNSLYPLPHGYLTLSFYFVTDKPVLYIVTLEDSNPAATALIEELTADNISPAPESYVEELSTLRQFLPYIKLSPRDVLQRTMPEPLADAGPYDNFWSADMTLDWRSQSLIPTWNIRHSNTKTGVYQTYNILADTGTILGISPPK